MKMVLLMLALTPVLTIGGAMAQTGSNIGLTEYPAPKCERPQKPVPPGAQPGMDEGPGAVDAYNGRVRAFNTAVNNYNQASADFGACVNAYVANGNADMARIKQRLDQAVIQANQP
jgi:hypothetical protein